jgi:SAM-dependent methyltransferase
MEGYGPASYGDGIADTYDGWYGDELDTAVTVDALVALAAQTDSGRVLELGVGSGRLALPLRAKGLDVWGIDASESMVAVLRAKEGGDDVPIVIGDMAELDLSSLPSGGETPFGLVFVAVNTFFNLTTVEAQARCLTRVREVLAPDGMFVVEAFVPALDAPISTVEARTIDLDRLILTATRHDRDTQTVSGQHIEIRESGIRLRPWVIRYAPVAELDAMAAAAGLRLVHRWADWKGTPFTESANVHVSVFGGT